MPRKKSPEKRQAMMAAAKYLFLKSNYTDVSMTSISDKAGISKSTLYSHFPNKEALFMAVIQQHWGQSDLPNLINLNDKRSMRTVLKEFATNVMKFLYQKDTVALYRTLVAEAVRFPKLSKGLIKDNAGPAMINLRDYLAHQCKKTPAAATNRAAIDFFSLLYLDTFWHMLAGFRKPYTKKELDAHINHIVEFFLAGFKPK